MQKFKGFVASIICFAFILSACNSGGGGGNGGGGDGGGGGSSSGGGTFWATYDVVDPGCVDLGGGVLVCDERRLDRVEIVEESTTDILGTCWFGEKNTATTGPDSTGAEFWCERNGPDASGSYTVKVSSKQANLPWLHAYITRISDGGIMWETYVPPTGGILNGPGGEVYSDPYTHKEFDFAGDKVLIFRTKSDKSYTWYMQHALQPLKDAGYTAWSRNFQATNPGFIGEILVSDTQDGRQLLGDDKIEKLWKPVKNTNDTRGNIGTFEFIGKYKGTAKGTASLSIPYGPSATIWEISADVTFDFQSINEVGRMLFDSVGSSVTQTVYTVADPTGLCYGVPASFTDTYPIAVGDGYLVIEPTDPIQFSANATLSSTTPILAHSYQECCSYRTPACEDKVLEAGQQQHTWIFTGTENVTAQSDGSLQGTYSMKPYGTPSWEWNLAPADN